MPWSLLVSSIAMPSPTMWILCLAVLSRPMFSWHLLAMMFPIPSKCILRSQYCCMHYAFELYWLDGFVSVVYV